MVSSLRRNDMMVIWMSVVGGTFSLVVLLGAVFGPHREAAQTGRTEYTDSHIQSQQSPDSGTAELNNYGAASGNSGSAVQVLRSTESRIANEGDAPASPSIDGTRSRTRARTRTLALTLLFCSLFLFAMPETLESPTIQRRRVLWAVTLAVLVGHSMRVAVDQGLFS